MFKTACLQPMAPQNQITIFLIKQDFLFFSLKQNFPLETNDSDLFSNPVLKRLFFNVWNQYRTCVVHTLTNSSV